MTQTDKAIPASRVTLHHFAPSRLGPTLNLVSPNNSDAREPDNINEWPPALILDLYYASVAVQAWGPAAFISYAQSQAHDTYYDNDVSMGDQPPACCNLRSRVVRRPIRPQPGERNVSDMLDVVLAMWKRTANYRQKQESTDAPDPARNEDVKMWLQSVQELSDHDSPI